MLALCHISVAVLLVSATAVGQNVRRAEPQQAFTHVTPVAGASWLKHIGRSFEVTSMGKTWELGPSAPEPGGVANHSQITTPADPTQSKTVSGADIYRLNCRACHGESGAGFVPEINSLIDPVRATSPVLIMQRMKTVGMNMPRGQATELARQAEAALLQRIHRGGENMPSFEYLSQAEVRSLVVYLRELAGVPTAGRRSTIVRLSSLQIGERIVKSLCHICHDAGGADPTPEQLEIGTIPPLATLTHRKDLAGLVEKVTHGAPIVVGSPAAARAGRMPIFDYLTQDEVAAAYLYLVLYPPEQPGNPDLVSQQLEVASRADDPPSDAPAQQQPNAGQRENIEVVPRLLIISAISLTCLLLFGGLGVTAVCMLLPTTDPKAEGTRLVQMMKHWKLKSRNSLAVMPVGDTANHHRDAELGPERIA